MVAPIRKSFDSDVNKDSMKMGRRVMREETNGKPRILPNMGVCEIKNIGILAFAECLVHKPIECTHALPFGNGFFCKHTDRDEIIKKQNKTLIRLEE